MKRFLRFASLMAVCVVVGAAVAADSDIMALRGDAEDGKTKVNSFQASWVQLERDAHDEKITLRAVSPVSLTDLSIAAPGTMAIGYLEWKNSCVPVAPVVEGKQLALPDSNGFAGVAPYLEKKEPSGGGFLTLLADELTAGMTGKF